MLRGLVVRRRLCPAKEELMADETRARTFRDDGRPRCPDCGQPVAGFAMCEGEPTTARCGNGHEWEALKGEKTVRLR